MATCKACSRPDRDEIDRKMLAAVPFRTLAVQTGISIGSLSRHKHHIRQMMKERSPAERQEHGTQLATQLDEVIKCAKVLASRASREGNHATANSALNTIVRCAELLARASGELQAPTNVGGIHIYQTRVTNNVNVVGDDLEVAVLVSEATDSFNPETIARLKQLAERASVNVTDAHE